MIKSTTILTAFILSVTISYGQPIEPIELAKKIFGKESTNIEKYCKGEYKGRPNGQDLQAGLITTFKLLGQTENYAVVNMTLSDTTGKALDTYLHFEKDSIWKMSAFRSLAMTGIIEQMVNELEKMTPAQIEEVIKKPNKEEGMFSSKEEYDFELGNAKLILESDDNIEKHFLRNQAEFERLKNLALKQLDTMKTDEERSVRLLEKEKKGYRKLLISSIATGGYELGACIKFLVGGMVDNSVGYLFVKDKKSLPEMDGERIIMIREIGNGWYIYKTT